MQVFPDQLATWFGMELATGGHAAALLFPRIDPASVPAVVDGDRTLGEDDFMRGSTEDRYPDHFGLAHGINGGGKRRGKRDRRRPARRPPAPPGRADIPANAEFLAKLAADL